MKRGWMSLVVLCLAVGLQGMELDLDGSFEEVDAQGAPVRWVLHPWAGYQPYATATLDLDAVKGRKVMHVRDVKSKAGYCVRSVRRMKCQTGDVVTVELSARGQGRGWVALYYYTAKGNWNQTSKAQYFTFGEDWGVHRFQFVIGNGTTGETGWFDVTFGGEQGSDGHITDITGNQEPAKFRGDAVFPRSWRVFAPVSKNFQPSPAQLTAVPDSLDGMKPRNVMLQASEIDLATVLGKQEEGVCCWAYGIINSPVDCDYTLGAGADWWMNYHVNGKSVINTMGAGNVKYPYAIDNHVVTVRLKKGENVVAVKFVTGRKSSVLKLGGAHELRQLVRDLKVTTVLAADDYDDPSLQRLGKPQMIKGNPTPGLMSVTGQGVYRTGTSGLVMKRCDLPLPSESRPWIGQGIRVQNFGRVKRVSSSLSLDVVRGSSGDAGASMTIIHDVSSEELICQFSDGKRVVKKVSVPYKVLPADFLFAVSAQGGGFLKVHSLADSSVRSFSADLPQVSTWEKGSLEGEVRFQGQAEGAEVVVDEYVAGVAESHSGSGEIPFTIPLDETFDPVKAGWKLVFADEFNGTDVDWSKWKSYRRTENAMLDGKGHLIIRTDYKKDSQELDTASLWSREKFGHGYFEARLRFTKQPGWWAAFWLYGDSNCNPLLDGFEIDIFEDYYTRKHEPGEPAQGILDHNLHVYTGSLLKSWNYNSRLPGSLDDFYVIGCKWTPFEISYYLNGRQIKSSANHSPYSTVTFDAFNHSAGNKPLHAIVSGQIMSKSWFAFDKTHGTYPEDYLVDYVRVYAMPEEENPRVTISCPEGNLFVPEGCALNFKVKPTVNALTKSPIKNVYLFDNGYLIAHASKPPYEFKIPFNAKFYNTTRYMRTGRSGKKPVFSEYVHAFVAYIQDVKGQVSYSEPIIKAVKLPGESRPYQGKAQVLPGKISVGRYDEGGMGVAYLDTSKGNYNRKDYRVGEHVDASENSIGNVNSGEWINYTVDIVEEGNYQATLLQGTPFSGEQNMLLYLDGKKLGKFRIFQHAAPHWGSDTISTIEKIKLPQGRHVLTILMVGGYNFSRIEFKKLP